MYRIGQEEIDAVAGVINERSLFKINKKRQETMHAEEEMKALFETKHALLMTSGHAALISALVAMGIGPGDQVILPAYTYIATAMAVVSAGAIPVIAEVDDTLTLCPADVEKKITPKNGILFVANSCEEGLGNLKGTRRLFADYAGRVAKFVSFDSHIHKINDRCVGSHRYEVEVLTKGGHSYTAFGNKNAIAALADIIHDLYAIELPVREGSRVTMNVGTVEGGTSVNTIAQNAKMLCEYRSDNAECIDIMKEKYWDIFRRAQTDEVKVNITPVGERPCARGVNEADLKALVGACAAVVEEVDGRAPIYASGSTDCNIPLSLGVPAVCIGVYNGGGSHTREEWVEKKSMLPGLEIAIKVAQKLNENA